MVFDLGRRPIAIAHGCSDRITVGVLASLFCRRMSATAGTDFSSKGGAASAAPVDCNVVRFWENVETVWASHEPKTFRVRHQPREYQNITTHSSEIPGGAAVTCSQQFSTKPLRLRRVVFQSSELQTAIAEDGRSCQPVKLSHRVPSSPGGRFLLVAYASCDRVSFSSEPRRPRRRRLLPLVATSAPLEPQFLEVMARSLRKGQQKRPGGHCHMV